ncbi:hypothetical protein ACVDG8_002435 [Mesorhizobium sp. ORM8.1]
MRFENLGIFVDYSYSDEAPKRSLSPWRECWYAERELRNKYNVHFNEVTEPTDFVGRIDRIERSTIYPGNQCLTFHFSILDPLPWRGKYHWSEENCECYCDDDDKLFQRIGELARAVGFCDEPPRSVEALTGRSFIGTMYPGDGHRR